MENLISQIGTTTTDTDVNNMSARQLEESQVICSFNHLVLFSVKYFYYIRLCVGFSGFPTMIPDNRIQNEASN